MDFPEGIDTILSGTLHQRRTEPVLIQDWTVFFPCEQIHRKKQGQQTNGKDLPPQNDDDEEDDENQNSNATDHASDNGADRRTIWRTEVP